MNVGDIVKFSKLNEFRAIKRCQVFIEVANGKFYVQIDTKFLAEQTTGTVEITFNYSKALKVIWVRIIDDEDPK